ncbi:hypothetical protein CU098_001650 [Rhizopus stolonifer]|uniref:MULE transposase domain-containing protein n=1 Tax=Rhizopus stolonifer TaxID=4846 RepID=A0A367KL98_RHIST|nr:hypothetical protein CU098_001650 [Rhizopus stolonifer]
MIQNKTRIPEISKNLGVFKEGPVLSYQDVVNFSNKIKDNEVPNSKIEDAKVLIKRMIAAGYHVRYQVSQAIDGSANKPQNIFFTHQKMIDDAKKMGQVLIMDATYLTNNVEMPLVCINGVHNLGTDKLMTFAVGYAFVCDEKETTYEWALTQLKELINSQKK